jgi:hypothetical protein
MNPLTPYQSLVFLGLLLAAPLRADVDPDLAFSDFAATDLNTLADGQVLQKSSGLLNFPRGISTQALYLVDAPPQQVAAIRGHFNPSGHADLKVWFHQSIPAKVTPADFTGLASLPDNRSVDYLFDATAKLNPSNPELQVSKAEAQAIATVAAAGGDKKTMFMNAWSPILTERIDHFLTGKAVIQPVGDIKSLLHSDARVYGQFQRFLNHTPAKSSSSAPIKILPTDVYYEVFDVQGYGAMGTGAIFQATTGTSIQSADVEFFVNSGVYATIELDQFWPITIGGKNETLVWRGDLVSAPSVAYLHGTERLASGMVMLQDVKAVIDAFRSEFR